MAKFIFTLVVLLGCNCEVFADDGSTAQNTARTHSTAQDPTELNNKRLPPVVPGQEIERNGKKIRVWSTSGPVPVNNEPPAAPEPWKNQGNGSISVGEVGVIVDRDDDSRRHDKK